MAYYISGIFQCYFNSSEAWYLLEIIYLTLFSVVSGLVSKLKHCNFTTSESILARLLPHKEES